MPVPRISQSAEAARSAAQQAEFNEKKWVWVPDDKDGYLSGWVNKEDGEFAEIVMAAGGEIRRMPLYALSKMNPPKFDRVEDIADLTFLNEASVVHNLRLRYGSGSIYTFSGLFLVAINPYQTLPLYSDAIVHQYRSKRRDENPPHIFAVAERAWVNMGDERENQSILITGESGAGKTESTKKVIQYLAAIATDVHPSAPSHSRSPTVPVPTSFSTMPAAGLPRSNSARKTHTATPSMTGSGFLNAKGRLGLLERQILQANPILEAFGNAQTQRNNNSSRFGKFVRIMFAPDGSIAGANIDWYLLEKSRVVVRSEAERSFHVFYQLLGAGEQLKENLLLGGGIEDYEYLNKSRREIDGVDDKQEWSALLGALDVVGFSPTEQFDLFRIVAAILHIGNIVVSSTRADDAIMSDPSQAERVCHLLGIPISEFTRAVLQPRVLAGREWVSQARTRQQAVDELGALCKTLYEKSFSFLVDRINQALDRPSSKSTFIGVLDIAGFEIFEINTYEQLLINYTNEKLQQFFNHHMFVLEQEEYSREGIKWDYVNFGLDLQPTVDLIESSGSVIGILSCLDEECIMPKATDLTFTHKLHNLWAANGDSDDHHPARDKYEAARFDQGFLIQHYAAKVEYRTDGWLEKNKDPLNDNLTRVLASSSERYVSSLFFEYADAPIPPKAGSQGNLHTVGRKRGIKRGAFRTVGQRHKEQLASLMAQLQATQPHFVRCIIPNAHKKPGRIDVPLVLDQLRCNGVLEGIRIARLGYPNRLPFVEFRQRYEVLTPGIIPPGYMDGREACRRMVSTLELDEALFKIGTSKIFFKAGVLAELEERRDNLLYDMFSRLQAVARTWTARRQIKKILNRAIAIRTIQRNARVYGSLRDWPWWQLYTKVRPLLAATRNDDELRRKEAELALHKERAERDRHEKEHLEKMKMSLEAEKRKVEDQLEAERNLALDKEALLERSKKREAELEEEASDLQADIDDLQSQLERAMKMHKDSEQHHSELRRMFDQAAEHLVRLENEQKEWTTRETEAAYELAAATQEIEELQNDLDALTKVSEELKSLAIQREEDLQRSRDRSDILIKELEGKLDIESSSKNIFKARCDALENEARQVKEQLSELARTTTDYSGMIQKKEERITELAQQLDELNMEHHNSAKEILELRSDIDTLSAELQAEKDDRSLGDSLRAKLRVELDELRALLQAKSSEETRRNEVEKSKEVELAGLRSQVAKLEQELTDARRSALENQSKLKLELDYATRELLSLQEAHATLAERERDYKSLANQSQQNVTELEKTQRSLESEVQSLRSRQHDTEAALADAQKAKQGLERQLAAAQSKYHGIEDMMLQLEREKAHNDRQLESTRKQLDAELVRRNQLEQIVSSQKSELSRVKDRGVKSERELKKALDDLKNREWEIKQLESKQDKTIVEHVHVLEEAKRVTDRQLHEAQIELQKNAAYIRSLEKAKARLAGEAEDLIRETERERMELRNQEKAVKAQEDRVVRVLADIERERSAKVDAEMGEPTELSARLDKAQSEVASLKRQLQKRKQEDEMSLSSTPAVQGEMKTLVDTFKVKEQSYRERLEAAEIARAKAARAEASVRRTVSELEKTQNDSLAKHKLLEGKFQTAQTRIQELERKLEDGDHESSDLVIFNQRLAEELEDEKKQHQKDIEASAFTSDQTRKKYQAELASLSEELQSQRDSLTRLREENRKIRSDYDELQLRFDDEVYNSGGWRKEKERLETKIGDITKAYEVSVAAQSEQQAQIVALHSQVRELRGVLDDVEADRALLQKARRALQAELDGIKLDHIDTNKMSSEQEFQKLLLQKQDLERLLEEQEDRVTNAFDRMKKAEAYANECQVELGKVRVDNSELDRLNANLENQVKELHVRVVDLETKSYANSSRPGTLARRTDSRIEEITSQLSQQSGNSRVLRSADRMSRDFKFQQTELDRQRSKMEEERRTYETQIISLRNQLDKMQTDDNLLQSAKRRAEREATDFKQKALSLERELDRLRGRMDRPSSAFGSPSSSPRK
ncbi:hypothetical protein E1B28_005926 [Marasmius oreades]|uniref:Nonmuscle myosin heavy chain b n=1 Tax=Marasmius oreades TaxID=181124 RepID=A0A9P7UUR6_9AGAR|nr:uncharacterized protein E1B28_005926 [Marasmius oreades]KAG7095147.1 hypothetical protein E1B28_005926 [Marasmius oreades]